MTALVVPDPGPERRQYVDELLAAARRVRLEGDQAGATTLLEAAIRAGLWSHSRLWSELRHGLGDAAYPLIRTLWLESPRRCHWDLALIRVVALAAATAAEHADARSLLRKAILRQGYRRRKLRIRLRRIAAASRGSSQRTRNQRNAAALSDLITALTAAGARPFLTGESLRQHILGVPLTAVGLDGRPSLELGVLASDLPEDKFDLILMDTPRLTVRRPDPDALQLRVNHDNGIRAWINLHLTAADGRTWREAPALRWWHTPFGLSQVTSLGVACYAPQPAETYLAEAYPDWRALPAGFDPRLDAPNVEVTNPELFDTLAYASLLEAITSNQRTACQRYLRLLRERGEGDWLNRLRLGDA